MRDLREWAGVGLAEGRFDPGWDWYGASLCPEVEGESVMDSLRVVLGGGNVRLASGRHGYGVRAELLAGQRVVVSVSHGGGQPRPFVETSGADSVRVAGVVRGLWPEHRVTRVDSAWDVEGPTAWEDLTAVALDVAGSSRVTTSVAGDWIGQERGRTLYLGAASSMVRLRIYEKGLQLGDLKHPNWVRCELQVRPERLAREALAHLDPAQVWGTALWASSFVGGAVGLVLEPVQMRWAREADDLRARETMKAQYGGAIRRWKAEYGDWATFGEMLGSELERL